MITLRPATARGRTRLDWLDSWHSFSFGEYRDAEHMGFSTLRVINEDVVAPSGGFATHGHRDMEIITWILSGELEHKDSLGNGSIIRPGDAQRMSAGTGILHSEFNPSTSVPVHLLQVWILPAERGIAPGYEQKAIPIDGDALTLVASGDGRQGSVTIHQDSDLFAARLPVGAAVAHALGPRRAAWVQVARGAVALNGEALGAGDGAAISNERALDIRAAQASELLVFDLPANY
jgi:hypothetical protein